MAGDWIKMRVALPRDPQVARIWRYLGDSRPPVPAPLGHYLVVGALHALWSVAQDATEDGVIEGTTLDDVDALIGFPGFGAALVRAEWLELDGESVVVPKWDNHNGAGAKRRAQETARKARERA